MPILRRRSSSLKTRGKAALWKVLPWKSLAELSHLRPIAIINMWYCPVYGHSRGTQSGHRTAAAHTDPYCFVNALFYLVYLAAPQGFEPRYADPEQAVLPLNEGAAVADE